MKRALVVSLIVLSACGGGATSARDSGIEGKATIGPTCPLEQIGQPPCVAPYRGPVVVHRENHTVTTFQTGTDGRFKVNLVPGTYTLTSNGAMPPTLSPVDVVVRAHAYTPVTLDFDSGIR
jgi:hypothetical protein